jgi:hypothetical protein
VKSITGFQKTIIFCAILVLILILWYCFSNPASLLKDKQVSEIGIYSISNKTLWDYGCKPENFDRAGPEYGDFQYNAILKGDALKRVVESLKSPSKSYKIKSRETSNYQGLYIINIPISKEEGFTFITQDLNEESTGRFIGYKYIGTKNGYKKWIDKWIMYNNPKLGQTLMELRLK